MKTWIGISVASLLALQVVPAHAQIGGNMAGPSGPEWSPALAKVFGDNSAYSATMEHQIKGEKKPAGLSGKMAYDNGKFRVEFDMSAMMSQVKPDALEQMKAVGVDLSGAAMITRPDKKMNYIVYPGMKAYTDAPMRNPDAGKSAADFKVDVTELGKETIDGHACIKNKVVVTNDKGEKSEYTTWNATDLNKFPVRIESIDGDKTSVILFKDVKLAKPDAALFDIPAGFVREENMMAMVMKKMMPGGMPGGTPPR